MSYSVKVQFEGTVVDHEKVKLICNENNVSGDLEHEVCEWYERSESTVLDVVAKVLEQCESGSSITLNGDWQPEARFVRRGREIVRQERAWFDSDCTELHGP